MKLIGFIKEHNNLKEAQSYTAFKEGEPNDTVIVNKVIDYLDDGVLLLSWMGYFMDLENGSLIAPDSYYTDGLYIWPAYFKYYLKKHPNYYLDKEFLLHLSEHDFILNKSIIEDINKGKLEGEFSLKLNES